VCTPQTVGEGVAVDTRLFNYFLYGPNISSRRRRQRLLTPASIAASSALGAAQRVSIEHAMRCCNIAPGVSGWRRMTDKSLPKDDDELPETEADALFKSLVGNPANTQANGSNQLTADLSPLI